jgi:hypothetical protein
MAWQPTMARRSLIVLYDDLILVNFDYAGAVIGEHLVVYFIHYAFVLETREVIYLIQLQGIDQIAGFID